MGWGNHRVDPFLQGSVDNFLNENLTIVPYNIKCHEYYKANTGLVVKCVRQRSAISPVMPNPAHIEM